jgi:hypothetical protein
MGGIMVFEIMTNNNLLESKFNLDFYNLNTINQAIKDFKEISEIKTEIKNKHIIIKIKTKKEELSSEELLNEFCNYLIALKKNE